MTDLLSGGARVDTGDQRPVEASLGESERLPLRDSVEQSVLCN